MHLHYRAPQGFVLYRGQAALHINLQLPATPFRCCFKGSSSLRSAAPLCYWWNETEAVWESTGCSVHLTTDVSVICACNHMTNFTSFQSQNLPRVPAQSGNGSRSLPVIIGVVLGVVVLVAVVAGIVLYKKRRMAKKEREFVDISMTEIRGTVPQNEVGIHVPLGTSGIFWVGKTFEVLFLADKTKGHMGLSLVVLQKNVADFEDFSRAFTIHKVKI